MSRIEEVEVGADGWSEWLRPERDRYTMVCCDCGLANDLEFKIIGGYNRRRVMFRVCRNERSTGQVRRHMKEK